MPFDPIGGYIPYTAAEWNEIRRRQLEADLNGGAPLDWDGADKELADLVLGEALVLSTYERTTVLQLATALDPNSAIGAMADNHIELLGSFRRGGTFTTASVTVTGAIGSFIPAGTLLSTAPDATGVRYTFTTTADLTTTASPETFNVRATQTGPIVLTAGAISSFVSPVSGLTITTSSATTPGLDEETDAQLAARRRLRLQGFGSRTVGAIGQRVLESSSELQYTRVLENDDDIAQSVEGLVIGAHSVAVIVYPPTLTSETVQAIGEAIYASKGAGIGTTGTPITLTLESGTKVVRYIPASDISVSVAIAAAVLPGYDPTTVEDAIRASVSAYFAGLLPGNDVIFSAVQSRVGVVEGVASVTVTVDGGGVDIGIEPDERAALAFGAVVVV